MSTALPPPPPGSQPGVLPRGPIGNTRSIGMSIFLAIITLGIYTYVWTWRTHEEIKLYSHQGVGGWLGVVIYFLLGPVTMFIVPHEVRKMMEAEGRTSPVRAILGLWFLLPLIGNIIWFVKVQGALNRWWVEHGATPA